jgi:hypothetical protein
MVLSAKMIFVDYHERSSVRADFLGSFAIEFVHWIINWPVQIIRSTALEIPSYPVLDSTLWERAVPNIRDHENSNREIDARLRVSLPTNQ